MEEIKEECIRTGDYLKAVRNRNECNDKITYFKVESVSKERLHSYMWINFNVDLELIEVDTTKVVAIMLGGHFKFYKLSQEEYCKAVGKYIIAESLNEKDIV
jgi:hypothetical protein